MSSEKPRRGDIIVVASIELRVAKNLEEVK